MASQIVVRGYGVFGGIEYLATLGYGSSDVVTIHIPGLEWKVDAGRLQWTLDTGRPHWAIDADRLHWKTTNQ